MPAPEMITASFARRHVFDCATAKKKKLFRLAALIAAEAVSESARARSVVEK